MLLRQETLRLTSLLCIWLCSQVCLAKANSAASLDAALVQDLRVGEGQAVEMGDFLEVSYTGWLMHNHVMGQVKQLLCRVASGASLFSPPRCHHPRRSLTPTRTKTSCCGSKLARGK